MALRAALLQLTSGSDPIENLGRTEQRIGEAAKGGATLVLTPEVTNIVSADRDHQHRVLRHEAEDPTLAALRQCAAGHGIWLLIGSLALKSDAVAGKFVNRSFLIGPDGEIRARYDKIHMFDVELGEGESYRESAAYEPGRKAVLAETPLGRIGMTICYDLRFPALYRQLAGAGADILTVPSAFTVPTGRAHWEALLRARAIETGCFVLAPAQVGQHHRAGEKPRSTYGHSLAVAPWGEVLVDAGGAGECVAFVELDLDRVADARKRVPSLQNDRAFEAP